MFFDLVVGSSFCGLRVVLVTFYFMAVVGCRALFRLGINIVVLFIRVFGSSARSLSRGIEFLRRSFYFFVSFCALCFVR